MTDSKSRLGATTRDTVVEEKSEDGSINFDSYLIHRGKHFCEENFV